MPILTALLAGLIFGFGLIMSGMANPAKVLGFLDLAGAWDPSLMFVMGGAIGVAFFAFAVATRRKLTLTGEPISLPTSRQIDRPLVIGSLLFGIGWGIAGFCPGPALVGVGLLQPKALLFVLAMLAGMGLFEWRRRARGE
ncbi:YeeE/YedE family protein [Burkholderia sp. LMU1-1-1.1]|uniref:YeeE/YedE family protein n=1 Tax=Burkholderia sp. LMU1-1-1.1 TaxID=3135266 RepID=UPI003436EDF5